MILDVAAAVKRINYMLIFWIKFLMLQLFFDGVAITIFWCCNTIYWMLRYSLAIDEYCMKHSKMLQWEFYPLFDFQMCIRGIFWMLHMLIFLVAAAFSICLGYYYFMLHGEIERSTKNLPSDVRTLVFLKKERGWGWKKTRAFWSNFFHKHIEEVHNNISPRSVKFHE